MSKRPGNPKATAGSPITGGNPTVNTINQALSLLSQFKAKVQPILRGPFTAKENLALTKSRHAVKVLAPSVLQRAIGKPNLVPDSLTAADLQSQLEVSAAVLELANQMSSVNGQVDDTSRSMQADMVKAALGVYALAEQYPSDAEAQTLVSQMKEALANGPKFPRKKVTTLPKPVTMQVPAAAAAAAAAAVQAQQQAAGNGGGVGVGSGGGNGSGNGSGGNGSGGSGGSTPATPTVPQVPVYTPAGPAGTAPATNGAGSSK